MNERLKVLQNLVPNGSKVMSDIFEILIIPTPTITNVMIIGRNIWIMMMF
jgi:hypothetical protein